VDILASLIDLIREHGYWALLLGCLLEGETVVVLAGVAAQQGVLELPTVILVAALGGFSSDCLLFWLGRRHGPWLLRRWPGLQPRMAQVERLLTRWQTALIVGLRFAYGLRTAGPVLFGLSGLPAWRFVVLDAIGALLWASVFGTLGWLSGHAIEHVIARLQSAQHWIALSMLSLALLLVAFWAVRARRRPRADSK
jgi:membrane protein DedA with SNARE-associated domain